MGSGEIQHAPRDPTQPPPPAHEEERAPEAKASKGQETPPSKDQENPASRIEKNKGQTEDEAMTNVRDQDRSRVNTSSTWKQLQAPTKEQIEEIRIQQQQKRTRGPGKCNKSTKLKLKGKLNQYLVKTRALKDQKSDFEI